MRNDLPKVKYVFCLTGNPSSERQALYGEQVRMDFLRAGINVGIRYGASCNVYVGRNACLRTSGTWRRDQKPLEGFCDYERLIWVDPDNMIDTAIIERLLAWDVDIVGAWYRMPGSDGISDNDKTACGYWNGKASRMDSASPLTVEEIKAYPFQKEIPRQLIEVDWTGFGCLVVKKGVFEALTFPWFEGNTLRWTDDEGIEYAVVETDDGAWCYKVQQAGFKIYIDPACQSLHEKRMLI